MNQNGLIRQNSIIRIGTCAQIALEFVRQEFLNEIHAILRKLNKLLPHLEAQVGVHFHALAREEVVRLTICTCDNSLDIYALEVLRQHLEEYRQMFTSMLADPAEYS